MINKLIVLANTLDADFECQAADFVDKIITASTAEELLIPLKPEEEENTDFDFVETDEEFNEEPTVVEFVSKTGPELVARLKHFFTKNPDPSKWSDDVRQQVIEAIEVLK